MIKRLHLVVLKLLTAYQEVKSSCYWKWKWVRHLTCSCRFLDSRKSLGKTTNELNKYISLLNKENYISVSGFDYSLEVGEQSCLEPNR